MKILLHSRFPAVALVAVLLSCTGDSPTGAGRAPAQIQVAAGGGQAGVAEMPLVGELVARVTERKGKPVGGVTVAWAVAPEAGTLSSTTTITDSNGEARTRWTLGPSAGTFTVTASVAGLTPATFTATAAVPLPARVERLGGDGQVGAPAGPLPDSLAVKVTSASGRPVPGATVAWSVTAGGGALGAPASTTDAGGIAKAVWTLGAVGAGTVMASVGTLPPVAFTATAVPVATVSISHASAGVGRGDTLRLAATPRDAAGGPLARRVVKWSSSAPSTASVDEAGVVSGLAYGKATITATSEGQSASAAITVTTDDRTPPKLTGLSYSPTTVNVTSAPATVDFTVTLADGGSGVQYFAVALFSREEATRVGCGNWPPGEGVLASGSTASGSWKCTVTIPRSAVHGTWTIPYLLLRDRADNSGSYSTASLKALGFPTTLEVVNTAPPAPPKLTRLSFSPNPVDVSASDATVEVNFSATAGAGVKEVSANVSSSRGEPSYPRYVFCSATTPSSGTADDGTWRCTLRMRKSSAGGAWVGNVTVHDSAGISVSYDAAKLTAAGFPGSIQVVSPNEDVVAPTLTAFSVSPTTVNATTGSTIHFTTTVIDQGSGAVEAQATLRRPGASSGTSCYSSTPVPGPSPGITIFRCSSLHIGGSSAVEGTWTVDDVLVVDAVGNSRRYTLAELKAAGFPAEITVTR